MVATLTHLLYGFVGWELTGREAPLWIALLLSQLPDFDYIVGMLLKNPVQHRMYFHNVFALSALIGIAGYFVGFWPAFFFIGLHILLDLLDSDGVPLLYPFTKKKYLIYEIGHIRKIPEKIFWDKTWWFIIAAAVIFSGYLLISFV